MGVGETILNIFKCGKDQFRKFKESQNFFFNFRGPTEMDKKVPQI